MAAANADAGDAVYLDPIKAGFTDWPVHILTDGPPDVEGVTRSLEETDYGKCVYEAENDVCDHQVRPRVPYFGRAAEN